MGLAFILSGLLAAVMTYSATELRITSRQADMESALYIAQGGAERAAAYMAAGNDGPWSSSGAIGDGTYVVAIVPACLPSAAPRTVDGTISINPSASPSHEFILRKPDGSMFDHDDLVEDFPGYTGPAAYVHVKPKGSGKQNGLNVDGVPYEMDNSYCYDFFSPAMSVHIFNDNVNPQGKAVGKWNIAIAAACSSMIVSP
jgi:hypothetical protein